MTTISIAPKDRLTGAALAVASAKRHAANRVAAARQRLDQARAAAVAPNQEVQRAEAELQAALSAEEFAGGDTLMAAVRSLSEDARAALHRLHLDLGVAIDEARNASIATPKHREQVRQRVEVLTGALRDMHGLQLADDVPAAVAEVRRTLGVPETPRQVVQRAAVGVDADD